MIKLEAYSPTKKSLSPLKGTSRAGETSWKFIRHRKDCRILEIASGNVWDASVEAVKDQ